MTTDCDDDLVAATVPRWKSTLRALYQRVADVSERHVVAVWVLSVVLSVFLMEGGILHPEIRERLPVHLSRTSLVRIIFNSHMDTIPRPRQVSFLVDIIDAHFLRACAHAGFPHFLSFSHYAFTLLIALALWRFLKRYVTANNVIALLVTALLLSSRAFEITAFFRSAKAGAALVCAFTINLVADLVSWEPKLGFRDALKNQRVWGYCGLLFALTAIGALFDEQSVFLSVLAVGLLLAWAVLRRHAVSLLGASATMASLALVFIYYRWWFPKLYAHVNGIAIDYGYQTTLPPGPLRLGRLSLDALFLTVDTAAAVFGNVTRFQAYVVMIALVAIPLYLRKLRIEVAAFVLVMGAVCVMNVGMIVKHPAVVWPDVRVVYYWVPAATLSAFLLPWIAARVGHLVPRANAPRFIIAVLALMLGANLYALPDHYTAVVSGHIAPDAAYTKRLLPALVDAEKAKAFIAAGGGDPTYPLLKKHR
jgi:hypothetical protein